MVERERFSRLRFKVHKATSDKLLSVQFPGLFRWEEFKPYGRYGRISELKYLVFMYDPNSDLITEFPTLQERKDAAATEAGFKRSSDNSGDWPTSVQKMMSLDSNELVPAVLRYLKICNNKVWKEICAEEFEMDRMNEIRFQRIPDIANKDASEIYKKRDELMKMCKERVDSLNSLYRQFYSDNEDLEGKTKEELIPVTPENVFKVIKKRKNAR